MSADRIEDLRKPTPAECAEVTEWFTYHTPTEPQTTRLLEVRFAGREMAMALLRACPPSADRTAAMRKLREVVMTANASIVLEGRMPTPVRA